MINHRNKIIAIVLVILTASILLIASVQSPGSIPTPQAKAQFIIASWNFPDEYGQGIEAFRVYENSTGDWVQVGFQPDYWNNTAGHVYEWNASVGIKLSCYTLFNQTFVGLDNEIVGQNYLRHSVTVTRPTVLPGESPIVFSQQNFTYYSVTTYSGTGPSSQLWYYEYYVILNFLPQEGIYYTATITYEIFY